MTIHNQANLTLILLTPLFSILFAGCFQSENMPYDPQVLSQIATQINQTTTQENKDSTTHFPSFTTNQTDQNEYTQFNTTLETDQTPPALISNVTATGEDEFIVIEWVNPTDTDFAGVEIRRATGSAPESPNQGEAVATTTDETIVDSDVENGTTYFYALFTFDSNDNYSEAVTVSATPSDDLAPGPVTDLVGTALDESIELSWTNPTDPDLQGVMIRRSETEAPPTISDGEYVTDITGTSYIDTGLTNGQSYYYSVFTYDEVPNYSSSTSTSTITPEDTTAPDPVSNIAAVPGNDIVELSWTNPGSSDLQGVKILRTESAYPTGPNDPSADIICDTTGESCTDSTATNGTTYYYAIYTYDENPLYSTPVQITSTPPNGTLLPPTDQSKTGDCTMGETLEKLFDGYKPPAHTDWRTDSVILHNGGCSVNMPGGYCTSEVIIDYGDVYTATQINIWADCGETHPIYFSMDGTTWGTAIWNAGPTTCGGTMPRYHTLSTPTNFRYVKISTINDDHCASVSEFEVFGY